jgi:hypothetical protein
MNKKISFFCLFFTVVTIAYSQNNLYNAVYNGEINYLRKYIEDKDINYYSLHYLFDFLNNDLRILRNTIYAMHGYIFKSKDLQDHFNKFEWYKGTKGYVENELNENELRIIRIIAATEAVNPPTRNDLIGHWVHPVPASVENVGYIDYYINSNGRIEGFKCEGSWSLEGNIFRTIPDDNVNYMTDWPLDWHKEVKNLRFVILEYNGQLYKVCNFFDNWLYESSFPLEYWNK